MFYFVRMSALYFRDSPFTWKAVNGAPWSCVTENTDYHFLSCIFLLKNLCESRTMNSGIFFFQSLFCSVTPNTHCHVDNNINRLFSPPRAFLWISIILSEFEHEQFLVYLYLLQIEVIILPQIKYPSVTFGYFAIFI